MVEGKLSFPAHVANNTIFGNAVAEQDICPNCNEPFGNGCLPPEMIASNIPASERAPLCKKEMHVINDIYDFAVHLRDGSTHRESTP